MHSGGNKKTLKISNIDINFLKQQRGDRWQLADAVGKVCKDRSNIKIKVYFLSWVFASVF
jgi:hypothetical protein